MRPHVLITVRLPCPLLATIAAEFNSHGHDNYHISVELRNSREFQKLPDWVVQKYQRWANLNQLEELLLIQGTSILPANVGRFEETQRKMIFTGLRRRLPGRLRSGQHFFDFDNLATSGVDSVRNMIVEFKPKTFVQAIEPNDFDPQLKLSEAAEMVGVNKETINNWAANGEVQQTGHARRIRASDALRLSKARC